VAGDRSGPACYEAASPALAALLRDDFVQAYGRDLPAVVQCFVDDFHACMVTCVSAAPSQVIRSTNLLERLFLEERAGPRDRAGRRGRWPPGDFRARPAEGTPPKKLEGGAVQAQPRGHVWSKTSSAY
jgi:hypothetical protein